MAGYFFDTSALVKRYVQEAGTSWVRGLTRRGRADPIYIARITTVELASAIARRRKGGSLTVHRANSILSRFESHLAGRYLVTEITPTLLNTAKKLAQTHELRAYDAVQLATALGLNDRWQSAGLGGIMLVSADRELNAASIAESLMTDDPNSHP